MYQPWVFAATIAAGSGLFAYAAVNRDITVPPDLTPTPEAVHVIPMPEPVRVVEPISTVVELEPIVIEAKQRVRAAPAPKPVSVDRPCSEWRELGPSHVSRGTPSGSVSVRELCP